MGGGWWWRWRAAWQAFRKPAAYLRHDTLLEAVPAVIYARSAPPRSRLTYVSGNVRAVLGFDAAEILSEPDFWISRLHADDRARCLETLRLLEPDGRVEMEYRLRAKDGSWRWLHDECRTILDRDGTCVEVVGWCQDVSARHRSEQALARSEADLRAAQTRLVDALESSDDGFSVFDADDRLIAFNSRYLAIYPSIADIIRPGVAFEELLRVSARRGQYRGVDAEQVERWVRERLDRHRHPTGSFEQLLDDGRWLEIAERPTAEGGRVAIRREITERKGFEAALREELRLKQTLIDALPYPFYYKSRDGVYLGCNHAFSNALGKTPEQIIGKTIGHLYPPDSAAEFQRRDDELLRHGGIQSFETTYRWSDGKNRQMNVVKTTYCDDSGAIAGIIGTIIDISEQKRTQEKLVQTARLATLGQIASEVAHELNQPLSILRMTAENSAERLTRGDLEDDALAARLGTIVDQAGRMAEMIGRLRSFVRDAEEQRHPFDPVTPIRAAIDLMHQRLVLDDIVLTAELSQSCPPLVGHPSQLEEVVLALISNARDAVVARHPPGGRRIALCLRADTAAVELIVRDNGGGVANDLWPRVFTPFFTTKAKDAGTGLGLSASANIVAAMGGRLGGVNVADGAEFRAVWPLDWGESPAQPGSPAADAHAPAAKPRILVVDDEPLAVDCLTDFLSGRGFDVVASISPFDALDMARGQAFDLVLTDQRMPGMDGSVLISRLRDIQPGLPAVMMSGGTMPLPAMSGGPVARLSKPLVLDELGRILDQMLSPAAAWTAPAEDTPPPPPLRDTTAPERRLWLMGELTAHLAHDFGQPLNIIRLTAENLLDTLSETHPGDDRLRRALTSTVAQCRRMQDMAQTLVADTRRPNAPPCRLSAVEATRRALGAFQDAVRMQGIALRWHAPPHAPLVLGHPHRLEAALRHLLDNACQALGAAAVTHHAQNPPWQARLDVACDVAADGGGVTIRIADNGAGIPTATLQAALDGEGGGLGLPIALGVVAEMGGRIEFAPRTETGTGTGTGTAIRIDLPAARRRVYLAAPSQSLTGGLDAVLSPVERAEDAEAALLSGDWPALLGPLTALRQSHPGLAVVVLAELDAEQARQAVAAGAMIVLPADTPAAEIAGCIDECLGD